jgi:hypothetical protein
MTNAEAPLPAEQPADKAEELLSQSDTAIARVLEDLVDVLITRGVIQFTDLPVAAQDKLLSRRQTRARLKNSLNLLPEEGDGGLL